MDYEQYEHILFERKEHGILLITLNRPDKLNATNERLHWELTRVWLDVGDDPQTRVAVITGAGRAFSAGGDLEMVDKQTKNFQAVARSLREAGDVVYNLINLDKPVISAINGVAVGAGLAVALMADVSIMAAVGRRIRFLVGACRA